MKMVKIKTADLIGDQLDWAVAKIEFPEFIDSEDNIRAIDFIQQYGRPWNPSGYWAHGGPIIERERIGITPTARDEYRGFIRGGGYSYDRNPLIAAMRAFVASKLGDEVEVPEVTA